jgi:flavin-dependent dehydrogenase
MEEILSATTGDLPKLETVGIAHECNIPGEGAFFDATNMAEQMRFGNGNGPDFIRADRAKLREWLLTNINVHWGKRFTHYLEDNNGVTAFFDDGTSYTGDVLVGADGINSRVRSQLLPNSSQRPKSLPVGIIVGELTATEDQLKRWRKLANSFFIGYAGPRRLFVGLKSVAPDGMSAKYYWIFGWCVESSNNSSYPMYM